MGEVGVQWDRWVCNGGGRCTVGPHPVVRSGATRNNSSEHSQHCTIHTISCQCYLCR